MRFTDSHEWIRVEGGIGTVGITDHAQKELGEVVYIELPPVGKKVRAGEEVAVLESTKAAADIYAPIGGKIVEVNQELVDYIHYINSGAEGKGWLFKIAIENPRELDHLLKKEEYLKLVGGT
ncbi:MAG: glycine cleavage system protein GcvH [Verrucomicrobia bacterium]|nr:glycine cleavage system protein GcvH [Verrucomicrobiota bacterium]